MGQGRWHGHQAWRVLIVDDEPPIRAELNYLLKQDGRVGRIEEAGGATEAVEKILAFGPEVLFLDIQMPGTSGVQLADTLQKLKKPPVIVFVTAFSEYAAEAFELDAADYVLKPVEQDRLEKALDKVENAGYARRPAVAEPVRRIQGERNGKRTYIPVTDIAYIEARADYASAHTETGTYLVNDSISVLERRLANEGFSTCASQLPGEYRRRPRCRGTQAEWSHAAQARPDGREHPGQPQACDRC